MKALNTTRWRAISVFSIVAALAIMPPQKAFAQETYTDINGKTCTISSILVNSCHPLFLANAGTYPEVASDSKSQILYFEQRVGRMVDVARTFNVPGDDTLGSDDIFFAKRNPYSYLEKVWSPTSTWADAGGSNATVNAGIDQMANSIKSIAPKKMFLVIAHEPESGVSGGATGCPTTGFYRGSSGTPAQYRAMWANIEKRFAALKVTNVVYVMNYMGYSKWNCMLNDLWPGNNLVDWVIWDEYATRDDWTAAQQSVYDEFTKLSDSSGHNYLSKPWGMGETAVAETTEAAVLNGYAEMKASLDNNTMPNFKERGIFDNDPGLSTNDGRVGCYQSKSPATACSPLNQSQQNAFNLYANDPKFK